MEAQGSRVSRDTGPTSSAGRMVPKPRDEQKNLLEIESPPLAKNLQLQSPLLPWFMDPSLVHPFLHGAPNSLMLTFHRVERTVFSVESSSSPLCPLHFSPAIPEGLEPTRPQTLWGASACLLRNPIEPLRCLPRHTQFQSLRNPWPPCSASLHQA